MIFQTKIQQYITILKIINNDGVLSFITIIII